MKKLITLLVLTLSFGSLHAEEAENTNPGQPTEEITVTAPRRTPARPSAVNTDAESFGEAEEIVVVGPSARHSARRASLYTPQQAIADTLSEPLTFVGRGIPDPIRDSSGAVIVDGAAQYCVWKNDKVYVVNQGCRPTATMPVLVMSLEVFRRTGQSVRFYAEPNSAGAYSLESLNSSFNGSWNIGFQQTAPISGDLDLQSFFNYYNEQGRNFDAGACTYGTSTGNREAKLVCVKLSETNQWREAAASVYNSPSSARFTEFHNAVRFGRRQ